MLGREIRGVLPKIKDKDIRLGMVEIGACPARGIGMPRPHRAVTA